MSSGTSAVGDTCTAEEILCAAQASGSAADRSSLSVTVYC